MPLEIIPGGLTGVGGGRILEGGRGPGMAKRKGGRPKKDPPDTVSVTRRLPVTLWAWVQAHAEAQRPKVTETAVLIEALERYREQAGGKAGGEA